MAGVGTGAKGAKRGESGRERGSAWNGTRLARADNLEPPRPSFHRDTEDEGGGKKVLGEECQVDALTRRINYPRRSCWYLSRRVPLRVAKSRPTRARSDPEAINFVRGMIFERLPVSSRVNVAGACSYLCTSLFTTAIPSRDHLALFFFSSNSFPPLSLPRITRQAIRQRSNAELSK